MAAGSIISTMFWALIAFSLLLCGASIYRGNTEMIAGVYRRYDPNKIADKEGLAKWVGSNLIFMGICTLIYSISPYFIQTSVGWLWLLVFVIICARLSNGGKEYEKSENNKGGMA